MRIEEDGELLVGGKNVLRLIWLYMTLLFLLYACATAMAVTLCTGIVHTAIRS
jgi:hypothetical protein